MMRPFPACDRETVSRLTFGNPDRSESSRIAMVSLPVPMNVELPSQLEGLATQSQEIGWWPDSRSGGVRVVRRKLLFGVSRDPLPATLRLGVSACHPDQSAPLEAGVVVLEKDYASLLPHQTGEARFSSGGKGFGLRLGVRWKDQLHWWQWLRIEKLWSGPVVNAYRIGGVIEIVPLGENDFSDPDSVIKSPWLHRQNWLFSEVYVLCFSCGVMQFTCRHVNNHRFDEGREQKDCLPVIGFSGLGDCGLDSMLDGSQSRFVAGPLTLDLAEAMPLVSPAHPGRLYRDDDLLLYHPYEGVEIEGDSTGRARSDGFHVRADELRIPKGLARSVRFGASLSEVDPRMNRLTVPYWWYALSGDLWNDSVLPVHDSWDERIDQTYTVAAKDQSGRFDDGVLGRTWEGEVPYTQTLYYYRSGNVEHLRRAIRDAYHVADIAFDHSTEMIRMYDYPLDGSTAPPVFRTVGMLFGYLETGDPYLLECAESASTRWYWMDRHMWPRYAYGRDAASIRHLVFLCDYTGNESYRAMAREALGRLTQCQESDGGYRDQGGATGIHAVSHLPKKPWMADLANDAVMDYLERWPDDAVLWEAFLNYADFLVNAHIQEGDEVYWPYEHDYGDGLLNPWRPDLVKLPDDIRHAYGHKARSLNLATRRTGDPAYFDLWIRFYRSNWHGQVPSDRYHLFNKSIQNLPYAQAHSWNARWNDGALTIAPLLSAVRPELQASIQTPIGIIRLKAWLKGTEIVCEADNPHVVVSLLK